MGRVMCIKRSQFFNVFFVVAITMNVFWCDYNRVSHMFLMYSTLHVVPCGCHPRGILGLLKPRLPRLLSAAARYRVNCCNMPEETTY